MCRFYSELTEEKERERERVFSCFYTYISAKHKFSVAIYFQYNSINAVLHFCCFFYVSLPLKSKKKREKVRKKEKQKQKTCATD